MGWNSPTRKEMNMVYIYIDIWYMLLLAYYIYIYSDASFPQDAGSFFILKVKVGINPKKYYLYNYSHDC